MPEHKECPGCGGNLHEPDAPRTLCYHYWCMRCQEAISKGEWMAWAVQSRVEEILSQWSWLIIWLWPLEVRLELARLHNWQRIARELRSM